MDPADRWHERVDDALTVELGTIARRVLAPYTSSGRPPTGAGAIEALEATGLLRPQAARDWRARFAVAAEPFGPLQPGDELRGRLNAHLGDLARAATGSEGETDGSLQRLTVALQTYRGIGLLDDDAIGWWFGLLGERRGAGLEQFLPAPFRLGPFVRSVPGPPVRRRGLRVLAVDLFEEGLYVRLHLARNGRDEDGGLRSLPDDDAEPGPLVTPRFELMLRDDIDTRYRGTGRSGGGGHGHVDGPLSIHIDLPFAPGVPAGARALSLYADDLRIVVRL